jgi:hypothetical protein
MHYDYVVTLKRDSARKTDLVSLLLILFSILSFSYEQIHSGLKLFLSIAASLLLTGLAVNLYFLRKGKEMRFRNWLFIAGICWVGMPYFQWLVLFFIVFALLEVQAKYPLEIGFYPDGVILNTLFKKKIPWSSLQSVVLKDGLLTLDFRNNKLFQKEVLDDDDPDAPEDEFNDYCRGKLVNLR